MSVTLTLTIGRQYLIDKTHLYRFAEVLNVTCILRIVLRLGIQNGPISPRPCSRVSQSPSFFLGPSGITVSAPAENMSFGDYIPHDILVFSYAGLEIKSNTAFFGILNLKPHKLAPVIGTTKNWEDNFQDGDPMVWEMKTIGFGSGRYQKLRLAAHP